MGGWNGNGQYVRYYNWVNDKTAGIPITSARFDTEDDGFATGLNNCLTRDGQGVATANLPMAGFKHTNIANAAARTDYAAAGQVQDGTLNWVVSGGTADAITAAYSPSLLALVDGQYCRFRATAANATTTPTFSPNGLTPHTITKQGGAALAAGDIPGNLAEVEVVYNLANTRWELTSPTPPPTVSPALLTPTAAVLPYAGSSAPTGWLLCNGQAVSRTTYASLFTALGGTGSPYGLGDGSTTFNVPDMRGRVAAGYDPSNATARLNGGYTGGVSAAALGDVGGEQAHTTITNEMPVHSHTVNDPTHSHTASDSGHTHGLPGSSTNNGGLGSFQTADPTPTIGTTTGHANITVTGSGTGITLQNNGGGAPHNVVQPTIILNYIIKT